MKASIVYHATMALSLFAFSNLNAQNINETDAHQIAVDFLKSNEITAQAHTRAAQLKAEAKASHIMYDANQVPTLYIYNIEGNNGFVIVSGEEGTRGKVLGYSTSGRIDDLSIDSNITYLLSNFSDAISEMRTSQIKTVPAVTRADNSVGPLLGDIMWGQTAPYNNKTQIVDGIRSYTGCVATATAQIMRYWKYPEQGKGSNSYENRGETLSANFAHKYNWNEMLPSYKNGYTDSQADAVATLMSDVGIAFNMSYSGGTSGTIFNPARLNEFFGYDKDILNLQKYYCGTEDWEAILRSEVDAGRPIICDGGSKNGAHCFVCDGYNSAGYFHYNLGWEGAGDAWLLTSATGYDEYPDIFFGIQPDKGGTGRIISYSTTDFMYLKDNTIVCEIFCNSYYVKSLEFALKITNKTSGNIQYQTISTDTETYGMYITEVVFDANLEDGSYTIEPVFKETGKEYQKVYHSDLRQNVVDVTVKDGKKTFANNNMYTELDEGKVEVDKIFYILDEINMTAEVTYRNSNYGSYSGDVVVPNTINYNGKTYEVTSIGKNAFSKSDYLTSVTIGNNIKTLAMGAFGSCKNLANVSFASESKLYNIDGWAFNGCMALTKIVIPESCCRISMAAFQSCIALEYLDIPASTQYGFEAYLDFGAFSYCTGLKDVYVHYAEPKPTDFNPFDGVELSAVTLHVPVGTKDLYSKVFPWNLFGSIVADTTVDINSISSDSTQENSAIFDLQGIRQKNTVKGLNIINGKKVFMKE